MFHQAILILAYGYDRMLHTMIHTIVHFRDDCFQEYIEVEGCQWKLPTLVFKNPEEFQLEYFNPYEYIQMETSLTARGSVVVSIHCHTNLGEMGVIRAPTIDYRKYRGGNHHGPTSSPVHA